MTFSPDWHLFLQAAKQCFQIRLSVECCGPSARAAGRRQGPSNYISRCNLRGHRRGAKQHPGSKVAWDVRASLDALPVPKLTSARRYRPQQRSCKGQGLAYLTPRQARLFRRREPGCQVHGFPPQVRQISAIFLWWTLRAAINCSSRPLNPAVRRGANLQALSGQVDPAVEAGPQAAGQHLSLLRGGHGLIPPTKGPCPDGAAVALLRSTGRPVPVEHQPG